MKKWKYRLRKAAVFILTAVIIVCSTGNCALLCVQAGDIAAGNILESNTEENNEEMLEEPVVEYETDPEEENILALEPEEDFDTEKKISDESNSSEEEIEKDPTDEKISEDTFTDESVFSFDELPDNDDLLAGYIEQLSYENKDAGVSLLGIVGESKLANASEKKLYKGLKASVEKIANGESTSTSVKVSGLSFSLSTWQSSVRKVISYLIMDCPYDLYWFDKHEAVVSVTYYGSAVSTVTVSFTVAKEYQGSTYTTNSTKMNAAKNAVSYAKSIVAKHAAESDIDKLSNYCKEICSLVSYNTGAVSGNVAYGNPWQLIWVFDRDSSTNVVCEGYAKAFQYLCDLSTFKNSTVCYTVTGIMGDGINSGSHMWNIVRLNGANYLIDVTNCDSGSVGSDGSLFLAMPKSGTMNTGYTFVNTRGRSVIYTYDSSSKTLLGHEILILAGTNESITTITLSLNGQDLKNNTTLKATFGKKYTLKAAVTGDDSKVTWSTSNKKIATVSSSGKVTVKKKAGTVTITAKTADGTTAKVKFKVAKAAVKVTKVKITGSKSMSLKTKKAQTLKATVSPASAANQKVTWKSSNKKIATVNSKGKVTAKKKGTVTITATAKGGSKKKVTIKIKITK